MSERVFSNGIFKNGDGPEPGTVAVEACDLDDSAEAVVVHIYHHADTGGNPFASVYVDPTAAGFIAAQLLAAARTGEDK